ncbi:sulfatase [Pelagicoccus sp. NFK12]|uniref:Sulfatase n=1 Tax=Pelagicoccus enzymogenes TaxID=2773457 RepID=A0A927FBD0_9BACT|nr:sulfatase [Pelagicoccus enzymogenes]MBD5780666.1 sulfatase [Pelagicoccus enzymogenes]
MKHLFLTLALFTALSASSATPPSIVIIFVDDMGYGDFASNGAPNIRTPNLDRMAAEGLRATNFYVASSVCSASRAALLTGQYPDRNGVGGVYFPDSPGMPKTAKTMAHYLKEAGYTTAAFGKWHLGDHPESLPTSRGFDTYWGIPYSNDMWIDPKHEIAEDATFTLGFDRQKTLATQQFIRGINADRQKLRQSEVKEYPPIMSGTKVVEYPADQATTTRRYFEKAIDFIDQAGEQPSFVLITPSMPHVPLFASERFAGQSKGGLFGDTIEEIDHYVGQLLDYLDRSGRTEKTLVVFTSDNGPWLGKGDQAGSAGPFRDGKFTAYEGGVRVPAIFRQTGKIPAGSDSLDTLVTIDLLPSIAKLAGMEIPPEQFDGIDITSELYHPETPLNRPPHFYNQRGKVVGVRVGDWKYLPQGGANHKKDDATPELYQLSTDISEQRNLADSYPEKVAELQALIDARQQQFQH